MITFIIGAVVGGAFSLFIIACCVSAGQEDDSVELTACTGDKRYSGLLEDEE